MRRFNITVNGTTYEVDVEEIADGGVVSAPVYTAPQAQTAPKVEPSQPKAEPKPATAGAVNVTSPMPGTVLKINVNVGDSVKSGQALVVLEAMKMENDIVAPQDGVVASINTTTGSAVETGDILITLN